MTAHTDNGKHSEEEARTPVPPVLGTREAAVDEQGSAVIPEGTRVIFDMAFQGDRRLVRVVLPRSVRKLGARAFAQCENLREVRLNDGLEVLEGNVFNGCTGLKELVLPDSLRQVNGHALYGTSLRAPVYNRSGTVLYHYPGKGPETVFQVPQRVKRLACGAFLECARLEEAILPEGLEVIEREAFVKTGLHRLTIPASVRTIQAFAFWDCRELEDTELRCGSGAAETCAFYRCPSLRLREMGRELSFFQRLRLQGIDPLEVPGKLEVPKGGFWRREPFLSHAARCARGDPGAMMEFAAYLESLGPHEFFPCAANFWRYRAGLYGDPDAARWLRQWMAGHPRQRVPSAARSTLRGCMDGRKLRALGFLFFDPERQYRLEEPDSDRIVRVSAWCGGEGPDGDGYGREELYDWWYLDEHLSRLPGVEVIRACSDQETRVLSDRFDTQHEAAVRAVRARSDDHFSCRSGEL